MTASTTVKPATDEKPATNTTPTKETAKPVADAKAAEAKDDDRRLALHDRTLAVDEVLKAGWSKRSLTDTTELHGTTILWRVHRLNATDVLRLDKVLDTIKRGDLQPPARKAATGGAARTAGPSRADLLARVERAEHVLDAATSAKSIKDFREAVASALEALRGETTVAQTD